MFKAFTNEELLCSGFIGIQFNAHHVIVVDSQGNIIVENISMLCKKYDFCNNPVYMDTSEIRLPDGPFDKCRK